MLASIVGLPVSRSVASAFSGTVSLTSGIATFGQVIPEGQIPSGSYVKVGSLTTQNDIKTTWSDGSVRFVVLTCEPGSDGDYTLSRDNASQASAMTPPAIPSNTYVELDIGGSVYRATCPTAHSNDKWLNGSLCVESRFEVIPILVSDGTTEHGFLRVIFDIRSYSVSEYRVDVTVENCLDKSIADAVTYNVDIVIDNSSTFTATNKTHGYMARWRKRFFTGTEGTGRPDLANMHSAGSVPLYDSASRNPSYTITGTDFEILAIGGLNPDMGALAGEPIAPYPDWAAAYLVHGSASQRDKTLIHADLAGSYSVHVRNEGDNTSYTGLGSLKIPSIEETIDGGNPIYWLSVSSGTDDKPKGNLSARTYGADVAHQPSFATLAYLITGDRYYHDEMIDWASFCIIYIYPFAGGRGTNSSDGVFVGAEGRHLAWGLRNLADAAVYATDSDIKTYLLDKLTNNMTYFDNVASSDTTPLGTLFVSSFSGIRPQGSFSPWQHNYFAWTLNHINKLGLSGGQTIMQALVQCHMDMWNEDDAVFPPGAIGTGYLDVREYDGMTTGPYHTTWEDVYIQTYGDIPANTTPVGFVGYNGIDHLSSCKIGIEESMAGAQAFHDYLFPLIEANDYFTRNGWAFTQL